MREIIKKRDDESLLSYRARLYREKITLGLKDKQIYELYIKETGDTIAESSCRCSAKTYNTALEDMLETQINNSPKSMMNEIREELGELFIVKEEIKTKTSKLNKIRKNFVKSVEIANDIKSYIKEDLVNIDLFELERIEGESDNKLIVHLGDWHVGYVIKGYKGNYYNYQIAEKRLQKLINEIDKVCKFYNISEVIIVNCGDITEGIGMRQNQSYECEFNMNEQISKAKRLLYKFITSVSVMGYNIEFISLGGNHQRGQGNKDANIEGDNNNIVIKEGIEDLIEASGNKRIKVLEIDYKDDTCVFEINGMKFKAMHGDNRVGDKKKLYDGEQSMDESKYKAILMGHYHNFNVSSQNNGGYVITCGSLFGYNPYSVKRMSCTTNASQGLIVVGREDIEVIKDVNLQII